MLKAKWLACIALGMLATGVLAAPYNTMVADDNGNVKWPQSINMATGNVSGVTGNFSNLIVNGQTIIVGTGGIVTVNGLASNQVGSLAGARNVVNNPSSGQYLGYNGANAEWSSIPTTTNNNFTSLTTVTFKASSGTILTTTVSKIILSGVGITSWADITGGVVSFPTNWASYVAVATIDANNHGLSNLFFLNLGGQTITSFDQITNSAALSGWANYVASKNIDANGNRITDLTAIMLSSQYLYTWSGLTNYLTFPPTNWSVYPAVSRIDGGLLVAKTIF